MALKKLSVLLLTTAALLTNTVNAQEASTTKTATAPTKVKPAADISLRTYYQRDFNNAVDRDQLSRAYVLTQVRTNWSLSLFDDKLLSMLTLALTHKNDGEASFQRRPRWRTDLTVFDNKYVGLGLYADLWLPQNNSGTQGDFAIEPKIKIVPDVSTPVGALNVALTTELISTHFSKKQDAKATNFQERQEARFGLSAPEGSETKDTLEDGQDEPMYQANYKMLATLGFDKVVKGLTAIGEIWYYNSYTAAYEITDDESKKIHWQPSRFTETYYGFTYAINESLSLTDLFMTTHEGAYKGRGGEYRQVNLLMLGYKFL